MPFCNPTENTEYEEDTELQLTEMLNQAYNEAISSLQMKLDEFTKTIDILDKMNINNILQGFSDIKQKIDLQRKQTGQRLEQTFTFVVKNIQEQNGK